MRELLIPYAVDSEQQLYSPETAQKNKNYFCPACKDSVVFKQGKVKTAHFAHKISNICNQETITHKTAKLLIQKAVHEWKSGKVKSPTIQRLCQICRMSINQLLPEKVDSAFLEYRLIDGSIVDVALLVGETAQAAIEIKVTHAVDELKINRLSIPFVELDGYELIKNYSVWKPITDKFKPIICKECKLAYSKFKDKANHVAKASRIELPAEYYRYSFCRCWKCTREIIVFAWPKKEMHSDLAPKLKPHPRTIQYRFSKTVGGKYWVNTCPYCQAIQGDFFLYSEPDSPFFALNFEEKEDSSTKFNKDMIKIAVYALQIGLL